MKFEKISREKFKEESVTDCIVIWKCSRTRACRWKGFHMQLIKGKKKSEYETPLCCPNCGNEEFLVEYIPRYIAEDKYVK